jgi:dihydrofolate synthase/folylpolyglutamate synthase
LFLLKARTLPDWLAWIETVHPREIELGLERVHAVLEAMRLRQPPFAAIAVAGTNGKGSTVAMLESCLRQGGYRVGSYTSPHLIRYNERVRIDGVEASDAELCAAFESVERTRGEVSLTYFEFGTLAALEVFRQRGVEIAVLEVGMGGRLDAVNAIDADVAIVTSIGIDHVAWLGADRESIAVEKAGIFRRGRPAICGDPMAPASIALRALELGASLRQFNRDFFIEMQETGWVWRSGGDVRAGLPFPGLRGDYQLRNAACALMALACLHERFPLSQSQLKVGLAQTVAPGRFQILPGQPVRVFDVAHNPDAALALAATLRRQFVRGTTHAVFGIMQDKDVSGVVRALKEIVDRWHVATLRTPRAAPAAQIAETLAAQDVREVETYTDIGAAYAAACAAAGSDDRVVVFGSFYAVGDILARLK